VKPHDFLLEIGVEEIPDWMIAGALSDLERLFLETLEKFQLRRDVEVETQATPRRLVLAARRIPSRQPNAKELVTGPPVSAARDAQGNPTAAALGFARKMGVPVESLKVMATPKGPYLGYTRQLKGRPTRDLLAETLPGVILGISWPKTMTWAGKSGPRFIRPIRWLIALYGGRILPIEIAGVRASNTTAGHRRLGAARIRASSLETLRDRLRENSVLLDARERRERIEQGIRELLPAGLRLRPNPALLETLVQITELPTPILGAFDREFLALPEQVLTTVMQHHQKYFSVEDAEGKLAPHFVAVMNIADDEGGLVRHGHERVLRARFTDARFFWETDQKRPLAGRLEDLQRVTFQAQLGSYHDKTRRSIELVGKLGGGEAALRAAELAKCDLTTELVKELTELQGMVGGLYARAQGEPEEVAQAIYDQYLPGAIEDPLPRSRAGQILALADRLDTLGGFFRLGLIPSGSRDPFALRRAAQGVVKILVEGGHHYRLAELLGWAAPGDKLAELRDFLIDRARYYFRDLRGFRYDEVNAVLAAGADDLTDAADRLEAIAGVRTSENFEPLAVSFKRIQNILRQAGWDGGAGSPDPALLEPGPEQDLHAEFERLRPAVESLKNARDYRGALASMASLRPGVDLFFDKVLVMAPDARVRQNRLCFLTQLLREFSTIVDFAEIVTG